MEKYSITEFNQFCSKLHPTTYTYSDENQKRTQESRHMSVRFDKMTVTLKPNSICFRGNGNMMSFSRVKQVYVHDEDPVIGTVFTVVCDGKSQGNPEGDMYTMIAE